MKSRVLMAALVVAMLLGVRTYAHDCGPCDAVDPCGACNNGAKSIDLFSGLKRLVASNPCVPSDCGPCDAVVACTPCDGVVDCDPCGACDSVGCNDGCGPKFAFGSRLKALFASKGRDCNPCDPCGPYDNGCDPCAADNGCGPCDDVCGPNDNGCGLKFSFRNIFKGFRKLGACNDGCGACDPCGADNGCGPCDDVGCGPCDDVGCGPCDDVCGPKFGRLLDGPRQSLKRFFAGFRVAKCGPCDPCGPCDSVCGPCDTVCGSPCGSLNAHGNGEAAAPASQLPEAAR